MIISKYLRLNIIYTDVEPIELYVPIRKKYVQALRVHIENNSQQWLISLINSSSQKLQRLLTTLTEKHLSKVEVQKGKDFVKKSVRIDKDMYDKLRKNRDNRVLSYVVNKAVMNEITSNEIDLIGSKEFDYKITIYFTKEEYEKVKQILKSIKERKIKVTFSSLVGSILYKRMNLVLPVEGGLKNVG